MWDGGEPAEETPAEAPEPITDEAILQALGLDPEDPFNENTVKIAVPLVRAIEQLSGTVNQLAEERELERLDAYWDKELNALEAKNGELPIERIALLEFAAENGYSRPSDAYWAVAGPAKRQVEEAVAAAQKRVKSTDHPSKEEVAGKRPRTSSADAETAVKGKGVGKAVEASLSSLLKDIGID